MKKITVAMPGGERRYAVAPTRRGPFGWYDPQGTGDASVESVLHTQSQEGASCCIKALADKMEADEKARIEASKKKKAAAAADKE